MATKKVKQFLAQKMFDKWAEENKEFIDEFLDLIWQGQMFKIKYGVGLEIKSVPSELPKGRNLGYAPVGFAEELFEVQKFVNKIDKDKKKKG